MEGQEEYKIPKLIHFVWAGGQLLPPISSIETIIKWGLNNPNWQVCLWVDKSTYSGDLLKELQVIFTQALSQPKDFYNTELKVHLTEKELPDKLDDTLHISIRDIKEYGITNENIDYEINKLKPNFGCSSDMLRYWILYKYGGAYFDMDIAPGKDSLDSIKEDHEQHILYIEHQTQNLNLSDAELKSFSTNHIGNDTFICTKNNPFMSKLFLITQKNYYAENFHQDLNTYHIHRAHRDLRDNAIEYTGPVCVKRFLETLNPQLIDGALRTDLSILKRVRDSEHEYTQPLKNSLLWLKPKPTNYIKDIFLQKIQATIAFEASHFHVLRLDDHIDDYINACNKIGIDLSQQTAYNEIIGSLNQTIIKNVKFAQVSGKYQATIDLYKKLNLNTIFNLMDDNLTNAMLAQIRYPNISFFIDNKAVLDKNYTILMKKINLISEYDDRDLNIDLITNDIIALKEFKQTLEAHKKNLLDTIQRIGYLYNNADKFKDSDQIKSLLDTAIEYASTIYKKYPLSDSEIDTQLDSEMKKLSKKQDDMKSNTCSLM